jgi:hypothetical protein
LHDLLGEDAVGVVQVVAALVVKLGDTTKCIALYAGNMTGRASKGFKNQACKRYERS